MTWSVTWTRPAAKDMTKRLDRQTAQRVRDKVLRLAETGVGDVKRLRGYDREWRLRVGDWRVRFTIDSEERRIIVLRVLPRGSAYR